MKFYIKHWRSTKKIPPKYKEKIQYDISSEDIIELFKEFNIMLYHYNNLEENNVLWLCDPDDRFRSI